MRRLAVLLSVAIGFAANTAAHSAESPGSFTKILKYVQTVADMERAYAFYAALGMEPDGPPAPQRKLADNAGVARLTGSPAGTQFRSSFLKIPGADYQFEFTEFASLSQQAIRPRMQDPGASLLVLRVRDLAKSIDFAMKRGAEVVTLGGAPLGIGPEGKTRIIFLRDPEGYYLELVEAASPPAGAPAGNIVGASFASVVADARKAVSTTAIISVSRPGSSSRLPTATTYALSACQAASSNAASSPCRAAMSAGCSFPMATSTRRLTCPALRTRVQRPSACRPATSMRRSLPTRQPVAQCSRKAASRSVPPATRSSSCAIRSAWRWNRTAGTAGEVAATGFTSRGVGVLLALRFASAHSGRCGHELHAWRVYSTQPLLRCANQLECVGQGGNRWHGCAEGTRE